MQDFRLYPEGIGESLKHFRNKDKIDDKVLTVVFSGEWNCLCAYLFSFCLRVRSRVSYGEQGSAIHTPSIGAPYWQTGWLETTGMYSLQFWRPEALHQGGSQDLSPCRGSRAGPFLPLLELLGAAGVLGWWPHHPSFCLHLPKASLSCVSVSPHKDTSHWI